MYFSMFLDVVSLLPKGWIWSAVDENLIDVWYEAKRGNYNRKHFVVPRKILLNEQFYEGLGLYLGDGDMNRKDKSHLTYASRDKDIALHALNFLRDCFNVSEKDITFTVHYRTENSSLVQEWAQLLNIAEKKIFSRFSNRHKAEAISIQVNGVVFRKLFEIIVEKTLFFDFLSDVTLRRALLRGLFAAEGNVGIDYLEKKPFISQITFALHINEDHIAQLITSILDLELVSYTITNTERDNSKEVIIYNWENYRKLWSIALFDLCERKKQKFISIFTNLRVYCFLEDDYRRYLFSAQNLFQREIAELIGSWQGNVSKTIKGIHQLNLEQIYLLTSRIGEPFPFDKVYKVRVGSLTELAEHEEFLATVYDLKVAMF